MREQKEIQAMEGLVSSRDEVMQSDREGRYPLGFVVSLSAFWFVWKLLSASQFGVCFALTYNCEPFELALNPTCLVKGQGDDSLRQVLYRCAEAPTLGLADCIRARTRDKIGNGVHQVGNAHS